MRCESSSPGARLYDQLTSKPLRPSRLGKEPTPRDWLHQVVIQLSTREVLPLKTERVCIVISRNEAWDPVANRERVLVSAGDRSVFDLAISLDRSRTQA